MRNMKKVKKILSFLTIVCCLAGSMMQVRAASEAVTRVVFENVQNQEPDLYVTKHVQTPSEDGVLPDGLKFTFVLKLDGKLADRLEYRVFGADGTEVFNKNILGMTIPFTTDRSGTFTLEPEQTAKFEYVGAGVSYEVTERTKEGWQQIQPAGGVPAAGTVTEKGAWAEFTNTTGGGVGDTELWIQKTISFPEGYEATETPDFTFRLKMDGAAYGLEDYTVTDMDTGLKIGTGTTKTDGSFTLKGGQTASFSKVPSEVDYEVTEEETEGWKATGETKKQGSTGKSGVILVNFNNSNNVSFAVSKRLEDNSRSEGVVFKFLLTREDRSVWAGASYILYDLDGSPIPDGSGNPIEGVTDAEGYFTLQPGQTAIFTGIEPGTVYNVSEVGTSDYVQLVPNEPEGYTDKQVSDSMEILPFVNRQILGDGQLSVTKIVSSAEGEAAFAKDEFHFILCKDTASEGAESTYEPVSGAVYTVSSGTSERTYSTDEQGVFSIKANETARFSGLKSGAYQVKEIWLSPEYTAKDGVYSQEGALNKDEALQFVFENEYFCRQLDLKLIKKNRQDTPLPGAQFMLYRDINLTNAVAEEPFVSAADGTVSIPKLKTGTYYLKELQSPEGYQLLVNPIQIDIRWEEDILKASVDGNTVTSEETSEQIYIKQKETPEGRDEVHITIYNSRGFTLPLTGSIGISGLLGAGILGMLMITGAWILFWKIRRHTAGK